MIREQMNPVMPQAGERYLGTVVKTTTFGAFVSLVPGKDGLLHISQIRKMVGGKRVENVEDVLSIGQKVQVEISEIDQRGKLSLVPVLAEGYDAVVAAVGTHRGTRLPIPGHDLPGVTTAVELLRARALGTASVGRRVFIMGGGNVAFDAAGVAHRLGAETVTMACLEPRDGMTASEEEVTEALDWGLALHNGMGFRRIETTETGLRVICAPVDGGGELAFDCDTAIFAVGQKPELEGFDLPTVRGLITAAEGVTAQPGVFAAGDADTGPASGGGAIAGGRTAAAAADRYLGGDGDVSEQLAPEEPDNPVLGQIPGFAALTRECSGGDPSAEAARCLRCHLRLQIEHTKRWSDFAGKGEHA